MRKSIIIIFFSYNPGKNSTNWPWSRSIYYRLSRLAFMSLTIHIVYDYYWSLYLPPPPSRLYLTSYNIRTMSHDILSSVFHYAFQIISRQVQHRLHQVVTSETIYSTTELKHARDDGAWPALQADDVTSSSSCSHSRVSRGRKTIYENRL